MKKIIKKTALKGLMASAVAVTSVMAFVQSAQAVQHPISPTLICANPWAPRVPIGQPGSTTADSMDWGPINNPNRATFTADTNMWNLVQSAGYKLLRVGGNSAMKTNKLNTSSATGGAIVELIRSIKAVGSDVIFQIPHDYSADQTKALWDYLNGTGAGQQNLNIKYWSIGNEFFLNVQDGHTPGPYSSTAIATYTKRISKALKEKDPNAIVQFWDEAWYHQDISKLMGGADDVTGKDSNGRWIIDVVAWHRYNLPNLDEDRANIANMQNLINAAATKHSRPASARIKIAYGEFNSHFNNALVTDTNEGYPWSMKTGQLFAELYGIGMEQKAFTICPWSMSEGGGNRNTTSTDLGIFDVSANGLVYSGRASYHHTAMLGQNMQANYASSTDNYASLKVVSMTDSDGTTVMLMNTSTTGGYNYSLNLSTAGSTDTSAARINVDAGLDAKHNGTLGTFETQTLVFNSNGALVKKYTYNKSNHWSNRIAPSLTTYSPPQGGVGSGGSTASGSGSSSPVEKLANSSFGSNITGWTIVPSSTIYAWSNLTGPNSAVGIMKADMVAPVSTNRQDKRIYQNVAVTAGKTYNVSISLRHVGTGSEAPAVVIEKNVSPYTKYVDISLDANGANDVGLTSAANPGPLTNTTWRTITGRFVAPTTETVRVQLMTGHVDAGIRIDAFSLTEQ